MKKNVVAALAFMFCSVGAMAQKESHFFYEETQARLLDVMANAYVKPLTVELEVTNTKRQTVLVKIPTQRAVNAMKSDPTNWKSYAVYDAARQLREKGIDCDVIVGATFNIMFDTTSSDPNNVNITVIGFPAVFKNWKTASEEDMKWIQVEKYTNQTEADKVAPVIKNDTKSFLRK